MTDIWAIMLVELKNPLRRCKMINEKITLKTGEEIMVVGNLKARQGYATKIYQDPISRKNLEGLAVIRKVVHSSDDKFLNADVEFVDELHELFRRQIYLG